MVFLVFVPGESGDGEGLRSRVDAAGASSLFQGCEVECRGVRGGPGYEDGVVCAGFRPDQRDNRRVLYRAEEQSWAMIPWGNGVQVGIWNNAPPRPETLAHARLRDSHPVTLEDGQTWRVPIVRLFPRLMQYGADGELEVGKPAPAVIEAFEAVQYVVDEMGEYEDAAVSWTGLMAACSQLLALNYRVERFGLATLLGVWSQESLLNALWAALDQPSLTRMLDDQKKSDGNAVGATTDTPLGPAE